MQLVTFVLSLAKHAASVVVDRDGQDDGAGPGADSDVPGAADPVCARRTG